ncbi:MAG: RnfABCDGE type electron transport complex subunit B [Clostridia bacterium]|nr:RnfABCDGE type electron transport complex subunit B [Clostridia bacterium]
MSDMLLAVLKAVIIIGGMGIVFGALLGIASKVFAVKTDERVPLITDVLPGANCGGCGFAGCNAYAVALCEGTAKPNMCPVGGDTAASKISEILGVSAEKTEKMVARVMCCGNNDNAVSKFEFDGVADCHSVAKIGGGDKMCSFGCLGFGSCVKACSFDGISIQNGIAVIDDSKCYGCGSCVAECPRDIIKLVPASLKYIVSCKSLEKGKITRKDCSVGCIGCGICAKNCPKEAIEIIDNLAVIDYEKCVGCGICATKCPQNTINKVC